MPRPVGRSACSFVSCKKVAWHLFWGPYADLFGGGFCFVFFESLEILASVGSVAPCPLVLFCLRQF